MEDFLFLSGLGILIFLCLLPFAISDYSKHKYNYHKEVDEDNDN